MRWIAFLLAGEPGRGRNPTRVPPHDLEDEHARRGARHRRDVERGLARRHGDVFRDRAEARARVGNRQIVIDGLRHADADDGVAELTPKLRHLVRGVHRVAAAVVEEIADFVRLEDLDQPLVLGAVLLEALELVARRTERAAGRVTQARDRFGALGRRVDHVLGQRAEDPVHARVDLAELSLVLARRLDHAARARVDDGRDAARLRVEHVLLHGFSVRLLNGELRACGAKRVPQATVPTRDGVAEVERQCEIRRVVGTEVIVSADGSEAPDRRRISVDNDVERFD